MLYNFTPTVSIADICSSLYKGKWGEKNPGEGLRAQSRHLLVTPSSPGAVHVGDKKGDNRNVYLHVNAENKLIASSKDI